MLSAATEPFVSTALVLSLAAVVAFIAHRAKQPLIVAFIAVGILVGPSALNWVSDAEPLELFADIGIAVLLFLVGLKLDLRLVKSTGKVALGTGLGQVLFTSVVGFLLALLFGMTPQVAVYVAVALTFSSTIIVVKLLSDKGELEKLHGRIALGFLIVQDIVVVIAMIVLSSLGSDRDGSVLSQIGIVLLSGAGLILAMWAVMSLVLPRVLQLAASSQELLIISAVAWAVAVAAFSDWIGFSLEVGAFLAGFALASTPYRESIASSLSGLRDFLLLFFFIGLGAQIEFSAIGAQIPAALALSLFVLVGNPLIVLIIMGLMRYPRRVSFLAGLTVAQISEFSLILIALGRDLGHVDNDAVGLVTLVGLITIGLSTYMIIYSHQLFDRLSPFLGIFERKQHLEEVDDDVRKYDIVVFGYGRFGRHLVEQLAQVGHRVLVIDWDPYGRLFLEDPQLIERVSLQYGDADDPEFPSTLPLEGVKWFVSTVARADTSLVLARALRKWGATGHIAVTALSMSDVERFSAGVEENCIDLVLQPFDDAANDAIAALSNFRDS
jgi:Kef-type K+ transport system membrane component KefB